MRAALNVAQALYLDDYGNVLPITTWIDEDGDECAGEDAVACVAGAGDRWFALSLSDFELAAVS